MAGKNLVGIDYGTVRIGIATADVELGIAVPLTVYQRRNRAQDAEFFRSLAKEQRVAAFVVGLPVHGDGSESAKSSEARAFGAWLAETTGVEVHYVDERYTTQFADHAMRDAGLKASQRKGLRDKLAAQQILSGYIERGRRSENCPTALDDRS